MSNLERVKMITKRRHIQTLILAVVLAASALAQQPSSGTPSINRLQQIITYLASDALEGRRTGTPGANDAAHYIAGEFSLLGLRPGMQMAGPGRTRGEIRARYLQPFLYVAGVTLGKSNALSASKDKAAPFELRAGEDWMPLGFSSNGRVGPVHAVFVGYVITDAELKYNHYPAAVKDKIALIPFGTPDGDNPHGKFARYEDVRWKAIAARNAGAKALVVIAQEENLKEDRLARLHYDNSSGDTGLPVAVISRQSAMRLFGAKNVAEISVVEKSVREKSSKQLKKEA